MADARISTSLPPPVPTTAERRQTARVAVCGPTVVGELEDAPVRLIDLSCSGVQLDTAMPVRPGQTMILKIGYAGQPLQPALARVQWVSLSDDINDEGFRVGLAFEMWDVRLLRGLVNYCRWYQAVD